MIEAIVAVIITTEAIVAEVIMTMVIVIVAITANPILLSTISYIDNFQQVLDFKSRIET